jgi:Rrf2 family protein
MRLSTRARYALRMMLDVARHGGDERPVSLAEVAERTDLSRGYLEQLAQALRNARLLRAVAGRHGGYLLARQAEEITVGDVIETAIGPVCVVDCIEDPEGCPRSEYCECRVVYAIINTRVAEVLHLYTLADLLDPAWVLREGGDRIRPGCRPAGSNGAGCMWSPTRQSEGPTQETHPDDTAHRRGSAGSVVP